MAHIYESHHLFHKANWEKLAEEFREAEKGDKVEITVNSETKQLIIQSKPKGYYLLVNFDGYPNNCGILIVHGLDCYIPKGCEQFRDKVLRNVLSIASEMGYSSIQYTIAEYQREIETALIATGFEMKYSCYNQRSSNKIKLYSCEIDQDKGEEDESN